MLSTLRVNLNTYKKVCQAKKKARRKIDIDAVIASKAKQSPYFVTRLPRTLRVLAMTIREDSDVDLIIISSDFKKLAFMDRLVLLSKLRKSKLTRSVPMDIIGYTPEEFENIDKESIIMRRAKREGKMIFTAKDSTPLSLE